MNQNSPEWYAARLFHFTSSELHKLMTEPKDKADKAAGSLSKSAKTYINDKVAELITNGTCLDYKELNTYEVRWGNTYETEAAYAYEQKEIVTTTTCGFFEYDKFPSFGGSPDRLVGKDGFLEIKCPYNTSIHVEYLAMERQEDLKKIAPSYYTQIQGNFIATGREWCHFVSYDPRCQNPKMALKILEIKPDKQQIDKALKKLKEAEAYKNELINRIIKLQYA